MTASIAEFRTQQGDIPVSVATPAGRELGDEAGSGAYKSNKTANQQGAHRDPRRVGHLGWVTRRTPG
jgi:hypothetical protein